MFVKPFSTPFRWLRAAAMCASLAAAGAAAQATAITVLQADDQPAHAEFVRQLRETQDAGGRFELVRVDGGGPAVAAAETAAGDDDRVAGVRTRSIRAAMAPEAFTVAVGPRAARAAIERPGTTPLLLAMLSQLDYESLRVEAGFKRADRRIGVLLRDPAMADQLTLVDAVMPNRRRLGVVVTPDAEPLMRELQRAAAGWDLQVEHAPDARSLAAALRNVLPRSDALMVLPEQTGDNQAATLTLLRAGAGAGLPVFGASEGLVRSGALAAAVSTPAQLAQQARALGRKLVAGSAGSAVLVEAATPSSVRINLTVARGLGLRLPEERELTERVAAAR